MLTRLYERINRALVMVYARRLANERNVLVYVTRGTRAARYRIYDRSGDYTRIVSNSLAPCKHMAELRR
jgi:hypothetical protein